MGLFGLPCGQKKFETKIFATFFFFQTHSNTGGPRYPRSFYLRIRLFSFEKMG
jgi:hypothetical protein